MVGGIPKLKYHTSDEIDFDKGSYAVIPTLKLQDKNCIYDTESKEEINYTDAHHCATSIVDVRSLYDVISTITIGTIMINTRPLDHT